MGRVCAGFSNNLAAILIVLALGATAAVAQEHNLVFNGDFELDADQDGVPDGWAAAGNAELVQQKLTLDAGREGGHSAKLECTKCEGGRPDSHAMLCQVGRVAVRKGQWYSLSFWARAEKLRGRTIRLALVDTDGWKQLGLREALWLTRDWRRSEFSFRAEGDCAESSRLQFWHGSTGTFWLDDVKLVPTTRPRRGPTRVFPAEGHKNLVPNASFECGAGGWGSDSRKYVHWGTPMNRLHGVIDQSTAAQGKRSLRIPLGPGATPVAYFDWFELLRHPMLSPLAGHPGWLQVTPRQQYVFSVYAKARDADTPGLLQVREFDGPTHEQTITIGTEWQRFQLAFKPTHPHVCVLAGPNLEDTDRTKATVWLDAFQVEAGDAPTEFAPRDKLELGLETGVTGNVFFVGRKPHVKLTVANATEKKANARVQLKLTDFWDAALPEKSVTLEVPPQSTAERVVDLGLSKRGFYRLRVKLDGTPDEAQQSLRLALIKQYLPQERGNDSRLGVNHAYPWPHLVDLCRDAGIVWVRDWSLKWHDVEPEKGHFDFTETDYQINRPLQAGQQVLGLLPFPSSLWASTAPPAKQGEAPATAARRRAAWAPRNIADFENYVRRTVDHYKDRIKWWQVFNEPLYTSYSLPAKAGYTPKDYARFVKAAYRAAKQADPECRVLAGIGMWPASRVALFEGLFEAGAYDFLDAVDVHTYPGLTPPEVHEEGFPNFIALIKKYGPQKPVWLTEHGYYADDDFEALPHRHGGFNVPLPSERVQAEYLLKFDVMLFANGVEKVFYHAGTCPGLHKQNTEGIFFEYGGAPRKVFAAVSALADLLSPDAKFVRELALGKERHGYVFQRSKLAFVDFMGNRLAEREVALSPTPVYIVGLGLTADDLAQAVRLVE